MALYTPEQLDYERSNGLELTDSENEAYNSDGTINDDYYNWQTWTKEEFENWLSTKRWDQYIKNHHRSCFKGRISICQDGISY